MSSAERKSDVQGPSLLTSPCLTLPFGCSTAGTFQQWSHISDIDHFPKPLKCDRLQRLPPPRSLSTSRSFPPLSSTPETCDLGMDPVQKVQQLERNLAFVKENHAIVLESLHKEVEELKKKNRELLFQLVIGIPAEKTNQEKEKSSTPEVPPEVQQKIDRLEKEIKKLRSALKESLKTNTCLTNQLEFLKREHYLSSGSGGYPRSSPAVMSADNSLEGRQRAPTPSGPSPRIDEYSETLRQIQRATGRPRNGRPGNEGRNGEWSGYSENRRGYCNHHQGRLPRLPLRNHQNVTQQQYDIPYKERSSNNLPALKQPLFPLMERGDKPRKPRGPHRPRVSDNISNH